uniref:uncharacterized protein LOC105351068 n=1 Tax=Fragaria vesca subsp. vesca TaxID=101020 RepID=UPI0005CAD210|nr:PREDICTED: uncharacterized protein LOC105351068 [Fragaria vesca subsp. vesca]
MTREEQIPQKTDSSSSQKGPAWENSNHPLYIHHSDQPGAILVPQSLVEDNFSAWIESMNMALQIKNKIGFVNGTLPKPVKNPDEQNQWNRCNILVKTWLLASMSKEISKSFSHCKDARTVWLELYERFGQTNTVQLFHIENSIHDCTQGSSSVTTFFTQLKSLWDEKELKSLWDEKEALCNFPACVCKAGEELRSYVETQNIMKFLMGLTDEFATVRSNIIGMDPLPTLNKVYSMCLRHEKQAAVSASKSIVQPSDSIAFCVKQQSHAAHAIEPLAAPLATRSSEPLTESFAGYVRKPQRNTGSNDSRPRCEKCDKTNHTTENCRAHLRCTTCNSRGHTAETCQAHLRCSFCNFKGHTFEECRKRKNMQSGEGTSRVNHISAHCDNQGNSASFPFSQEDCKTDRSLEQIPGLKPSR